MINTISSIMPLAAKYSLDQNGSIVIWSFAILSAIISSSRSFPTNGRTSGAISEANMTITTCADCSCSTSSHTWQ